ncbi:MAG: aldehyde ferredoxin oxidoreductase, partial [Candidatus Lokiarchaeota archaeon]|nr:aldehyde ferredoxin oxidoreductase [Candidatus Lokiarchaeota archaeon]
MPKIYRIDLANNEIKKESIQSRNQLELYAGRALSSKIIADEVPPETDPLDSENKLIFATGFLSGTFAPNSGRISIGAKSPLTQGIKESNVGGRAPSILAKHDVRALILEKMAEEWKVIHVSEKGIKILQANDLAELDNYELAERLIAKYGKNVGAFTIGSAGNRLFLNASIASIDMQGYPSRHAGRGGLGAVMGSKKVKAIVLEPPKQNKIKYYNQSEFKNYAVPWFKELNESKRVFSKYGTAIGVSGMSETHGLPTQNFRRGSFKDVEKISGDALHDFLEENKGKFSVACSPGCAIRCSNIVYNKDGKHITSSLEYETIAMNGSNLMINDIEKIAWIDHYSDDIGIDSIECGNTIAMYMEAGDIEWGDADAVIELLKGIKENKQKSLDLGLGCYRLGKKLGIKRIPQVKKQGFPGYDPRSYKGMGITYYTSPMGADHTAGPAIINRKAYSDKEYNASNPWDPKYKVLLSKELQIFIMILDSMGLCYFVGPSFEVTKTLSHLL